MHRTSTGHCNKHAMKTEKRKINVLDLKKGMYVSELDKPWLESPFLLQGFLIQDDQEIQQLQQICRYVFIDELQSKVAIKEEDLTEISDGLAPLSAREINIGSAADAKKALGRGGTIAELPGPIEPPKIEFTNELDQARQVHEHLNTVVNNLYDSISRNKVPDFQQVSGVVSDVVYSLNRNEFALEWLSQLKSKDQFAAQHSMNVAIFSAKLGRHLGMDDELLKTLGMCGLMHDIGKIKIPENILRKPARLSAPEMKIMEVHPEIGMKIMKKMPNVPLDVINTCMKHHERLDGKGYPDQLSGDNIDLMTRIISIADAYDAITSENDYNPGYSPSHAMSELYKQKGKAYDAELVDAFIRCIGVFPVGTVIETHTGEVGIVISTSDNHKLNPSIIMVLNNHKQPFKKAHILNSAIIYTEDGDFRFNIKRALNAGNYGVHPKDHFIS